MVTIRDLLTDCGLARIADIVEAAVRPTVFLTPVAETEAACTRLGGRPNLPPELVWPNWHGRSLPFVAQLDLAAIPQAKELGLPREGSLHFFYEGGGEAWGFRPQDRGSAKVFCTAYRLSESPLRDYPDDVEEEMRFRGVQLDATTAVASLPDYEDPLLATLGLSQEERDQYFTLLEAWRQKVPPTGHRIGGHPESIQDDPKLQAQIVSNGIDAGTPGGYEQAKELGLWEGAGDWELLLQVDSDESAAMMWGDMGRLYFMIRRQDLAQLNFESCWLVFQCG
ncbi:MAG: hypothetical protein C0504_07320 [Candidatus Solibacter sp.]|nr:hypothetical protein [Candidatus Solibacter sp.]